MARPEIASAEEWQRQRDELLVIEKEATRRLDAIAAQRRRLPMVRFDNDKYVFETSTGPKRLLDFFDGRRQLAQYQFMDVGPDSFCPGCTNLTNNVTALDTLEECDLSWITISDMPLAQMEGYWEKKGWKVPFASSHGTDFVADCGGHGSFMFNMFFTDGEGVYRTYNTTGRGLDRVMFIQNIRDMAPYGRGEDWEDSPEGWPQEPTYG
jgi:predicted dithiol-disulfide oxidoreductase (DUF899 family)